MDEFDVNINEENETIEEIETEAIETEEAIESKKGYEPKSFEQMAEERGRKSFEDMVEKRYDDYSDREYIEGSCSDKPKEESANINKGAAYYNEVLVSEKPKKDYTSFKRFIAGALVASVVGGTMIGVGLQVSKPVSEYLSSVVEQKMNERLANVQIENSDSLLTQVNSLSVNTENISPAVAIYRNVSPSVVGITSTITNVDYFYGAYDESASGSGIVFNNTDEKVYIVTNNHVVEGANKIVVTLNGGEKVEASLVGADSRTDLAVLSVSKKDMTADSINDVVVALFGDSSELEVGELAVAIGNPLGEQFNNSISQGIISGIDRLIQVDDRNLSMIQTDAAINPGNSGGPLVNSKSQVIGINTIKYTDSTVEGMGFAIPTNIAKPIIEEIMEKGYVSRPLLGITGMTITEQAADIYGYPVGVYVYTVSAGSGAELAGIQKGDVITEFAGEKITTFEQMYQLIGEQEVGSTVKVRVTRNDSVYEFDVVLQDSNAAANATQEKSSSNSNNRIIPRNN